VNLDFERPIWSAPALADMDYFRSTCDQRHQHDHPEPLGSSRLHQYGWCFVLPRGWHWIFSCSHKCVSSSNANPYFDRFVPFLDNPLLQDFYYILVVQAKVDDGVFIRNNPLLCLKASTQWTRRNESYLEYDTSRVCKRFSSSKCCF
jgi:hypothetical protein